jgi:hypothetical protein
LEVLEVTERGEDGDEVVDLEKKVSKQGLGVELRAWDETYIMFINYQIQGYVFQPRTGISKPH